MWWALLRPVNSRRAVPGPFACVAPGRARSTLLEWFWAARALQPFSLRDVQNRGRPFSMANGGSFRGGSVYFQPRVRTSGAWQRVDNSWPWASSNPRFSMWISQWCLFALLRRERFREGVSMRSLKGRWGEARSGEGVSTKSVSWILLDAWLGQFIYTPEFSVVQVKSASWILIGPKSGCCGCCGRKKVWGCSTGVLLLDPLVPGRFAANGKFLLAADLSRVTVAVSGNAEFLLAASQAGSLGQPLGMLNSHWWKTEASSPYADVAITFLAADERLLGWRIFLIITISWRGRRGQVTVVSSGRRSGVMYLVQIPLWWR